MVSFHRKPEKYSSFTRGGLSFYRDPVHGYIPLPTDIRRAVDLPSMQRLRHIKQLGPLNLVFAGATHTRFEHSVGTYYLATRVLDVIKDQCSENKEIRLSDEKCLAVQLAALFHDVGHGPFSHVFDMYCKRSTKYADLDSEKLTRRLITEGVGGYNDIPNFLRDLYNKRKSAGADESEIAYLEPSNIADLALGKPPRCAPECRFLSDIISSEIDVDRMDYLKRDALYTAAAIGEVDIGGIIYNFVVAKEEEGVEKPYRLMVYSSAADSVEAMLVSRDFAYRRVYYNETNRIIQEMMLQAIDELATYLDEQNNPTEHLALATDEQLIELLLKHGSPFAKDVANRIIQRAPYRALPFTISLREEQAIELAPNLWKLIKDKKWKSEFEALFTDDRFKTKWRIIIDVQSLPLSHTDDYDRKFIVDSLTHEIKTLREFFPHLELLYGGRFLPPNRGEVLTYNTVYASSFPKITIALPWEFVTESLKNCLDPDAKENNLETILQIDYNINFKPIFEKLFDNGSLLSEALYKQYQRDQQQKGKTQSVTFEQYRKSFLEETVTKLTILFINQAWQEINR